MINFNKRLAKQIIENSSEFKLKQVGYLLTGNELTVWSKNAATSAFHGTRLCNVFGSMGFSCYVDYNTEKNRCELKIF